METLDNVNPEIHQKCSERPVTQAELDDDVEDSIDSREVFDILRGEYELHLFIIDFPSLFPYVSTFLPVNIVISPHLLHGSLNSHLPSIFLLSFLSSVHPSLHVSVAWKFHRWL